MNHLIEISEKLFQELEKKKKSPDETIENVIWNLIDQLNTKINNNLPNSYTKNNFSSILRHKTLKDIFG